MLNNHIQICIQYENPPVPPSTLSTPQTFEATGGLAIEFARLAPREALGVPPGVLLGSPNMR
jgi:hypothetical protein